MNEKRIACWISGVLIEKIPLLVGGESQDLPLVWEDGMIGVLPVFRSEEAARKYRDELNPDGDLIAIEVAPKKPLKDGVQVKEKGAAE